jgi:hypothetical protein
MLHLTSGPALVVEIGLAIFCFVDVLMAPEAAVRWIPRWAWVLCVLAFPACGCILWIFAGRSWRSRVRTGHRLPGKGAATTAGVADHVTRDARPSGLAASRPDFSEDLRRVNAEHEKTLLRWEAALRDHGAA